MSEDRARRGGDVLGLTRQRFLKNNVSFVHLSLCRDEKLFTARLTGALRDSQDTKCPDKDEPLQDQRMIFFFIVQKRLLPNRWNGRSGIQKEDASLVQVQVKALLAVQSVDAAIDIDRLVHAGVSAYLYYAP